MMSAEEVLFHIQCAKNAIRDGRNRTMTDTEKRIAEIREALEKATPGPWKWEGVQHATSGSLYEPTEMYHPAEVFVEVDDEQLISDDIVVIAILDDPMYLVEGDTGERYLGSANANANLIANAPEWLQFLLDELDRLRAERDSHGPEGRNYTNKQYVDLLMERDKLIEGLHNYMKELDRRYQKAYRNYDIDCDHHQLGMAEAYDVAERRLRDILKEIGVTVE